MIPDLETLFTHPSYWGVETATPCQRAFCRIAEGMPLGDLARDPDVRWCVGGDEALAILAPGGPPPRHLSVYGAVRIGKSDLASCIAFRASQTIDLAGVRSHEVPYIPIVCLTIPLGRVTLGHLKGRLHQPALRPLLVEEDADSVIIRHPSGAHIEIGVAAGARAGGRLIARWNGGGIFDEKPRMLGEDEAVVNYDDARRAVEGRLLPGAQIIDLGSPYAPWGPAFDDVKDRWGKPTRHHVVLRVTGPMANPRWWTPERCADLEERDQRAYQTECLGNFAESASSALRAEWVDAAIHPTPQSEPMSGMIGLLDSSAGRGDAFTWAAAEWRLTNPDQEYEAEELIENGQKFEVYKLDVYGRPIPKVREPRKLFIRVFGFGRVAGKFREELSFDDLVTHIASRFRSLGVQRAIGDEYQSYPLEAAFQRLGRIHYRGQNWNQPGKTEALARLRNWLRDGTIVIDAGGLSAAVRTELVQLQEKPTSAGGTTIGARRGGHDDLCALILDVAMLDSAGEFAGSPTRRVSRLIT